MSSMSILSSPRNDSSACGDSGVLFARLVRRIPDTGAPAGGSLASAGPGGEAP